MGVNMGITSWHLPFLVCAVPPGVQRTTRSGISFGGAGGLGCWDAMAGGICHLALVRFFSFGGGAGGWALGR